MINWQKIKAQIAPYADVMRFMAVLLIGNALWKMIFKGDEMGNYITCCGHDITHFFTMASTHVAKVCFLLVHALDDAATLQYGHVISFPNATSVSIVWGCSAVKQGVLFTLIMLFAKGNYLHKLWFIPLGWIAVYVFNILRITIIALLIQHHPTWFEFLHSYFFKYLFYAMIFALWVIWTERLAKRA